MSSGHHPQGERGSGEPLPGDRETAADDRPMFRRAAAWFMRGPMNRVLYGVSALFLAIFVIMAQTVVAQRQARQEVMLQDDTLLSLNTLMETMLDAETGQRGYLLTGDGAYLAPFLQARAKLAPQLNELGRMALLAGDDEQRRLALADRLIRARMAEMSRTVELADAGMMPSAMAVVRSNAGQQEMAALRRELRWLRDGRADARRAALERVQRLEDRLLPLVGVLGLGLFVLVVVAVYGERHRACAEAEARQFAALRAANDQTQLLARELDHRVKNLFSVVLSIITISARKQAPTAEVLDDIRSRVHALSQAHSGSQGAGSQGAGSDAALAGVIANIMRPYAQDRPGRVILAGPEVRLPPRMITPMGLLLHELATNGLKYGALSVESGTVELGWRIAAQAAGGRELVLDWIETGGPAPHAPADEARAAPQTGGFGSRLTALAARQMGGRLERSWPETGATVKLICPLP